MREVEIDSKPGPGEVRIRYLASPVNPADIDQVQGSYLIKLSLLAIDGNEMVGVGKNLSNFCVGGRSALLLINCLEDESVMVTYGGMSKQPVQAPSSPFILKNVQLRGFWMSHWYAQLESETERKKIFSELTNLIRNGKLRPTNFDKYKLDDWKKAFSNTMNLINGKRLFVH